MGKCRIRAPEDRDVCTRRANRPGQGEPAKERPVAPAYFHAASRCNMLQAMQRGQTALPMHDNIMNRSRACRVGRKWRERNGRGYATREREGRQTDLITIAAIVNGINGISHEGQTRRTRELGAIRYGDCRESGSSRSRCALSRACLVQGREMT